MNNWRTGNTIQGVYEYRPEHTGRLGNINWMPKSGDMCVCVAHSGDCFNNYVAMRKNDDGKFVMVGEFGAYFFGTKIGTLPKRDFHRLQAGDLIIWRHHEHT